MQVKIEEIPEEGLSLTEQVSPAQLALDTQEQKFVSALEVAADFMKQHEMVGVDVAVTGRQQLVCGRCLEPFERPYSSSFHFDYPVKDKVVLDVTDDVRQEVLLSYPLLVICRKECAGLCAVCGKNLNEGSCQCNRSQSGKE